MCQIGLYGVMDHGWAEGVAVSGARGQGIRVDARVRWREGVGIADPRNRGPKSHYGPNIKLVTLCLVEIVTRHAFFILDGDLP